MTYYLSRTQRPGTESSPQSPLASSGTLSRLQFPAGLRAQLVSEPTHPARLRGPQPCSPGCCNARASRSPSKTSALFRGSLLALKRGCTLHNGPLLAIRGPMPGRSMLLSAPPQRANEHSQQCGRRNGSGLATGWDTEAAPERPPGSTATPAQGKTDPR